MQPLARADEWQGVLGLFAQVAEGLQLTGSAELTYRADHFFLRALAAHERGDLIVAIADYDRVLVLDPADPAAYYNRGNAHKAQGDLVAAISDYDRASELNPADAATYYNRGLAHADQGDLAAAIADYDRALQCSPAYAVAYYNRGLVRHDQGDLAAAIVDYDRAIELFSDGKDKATAYNNLGNARHSQGDVAAAVADYDRALELYTDGKDKARTLRNKGAALSRLGDWAAADAVYQQATTLDADSFYGWMGLADAERAAGNTVALQAALAQARATQGDAGVYDQACLASIAGEVDLALTLLAAALAAAPGQAAWARTDPDLRWLHADERFWALVGRGETTSTQRHRDTEPQRPPADSGTDGTD